MAETEILTDSEVAAGRQEYRHDRVYRLGDGRKVRTRLRRDFYDFQSWARAEVWTGGQWNQVLEWDGDSPFLKGLPSVHSGQGTVEKASNAASWFMLTEARKVLE